MYDEPDDKIILTNHSRPIGTLTAIDPKTGDIVATVELEDTAPEGAAADGKGHIFVNNESKNTIQVIDVKTWKATASWPLAPCEGPTGIAYDKASNRIFSGCSKTSVVVDASTGKVVASITNGTRVDALGWDPSKKLIYIPNGGEGNVTVVHQDSPDKYTVVATVATFAGAKTIAVDPATHNVYLFQPERGPAPPPAAGAPPPAAGADAAAARRVRSSRRGSSSSSHDSLMSVLASAVNRHFAATVGFASLIENLHRVHAPDHDRRRQVQRVAKTFPPDARSTSGRIQTCVVADDGNAQQMRNKRAGVADARAVTWHTLFVDANPFHSAVVLMRNAFVAAACAALFLSVSGLVIIGPAARSIARACTGARSARRAPAARARSPACRASRTSSTSASTTAASGAPPTTARRGCRCSTTSRPDRSARSPSRRRIRTSSTSAAGAGHHPARPRHRRRRLQVDRRRQDVDAPRSARQRR